MRITCPNCTAGFEIPTELLGRKGRSLKCATCGHSWFQAAIVDEIDLADVIAETKSKDAEKDMGGKAGRRNAPDTAAIAAAANEAIGKPTDPSIPPPTPSGGLGTAGGPAPKPPSDVPEGATSLLGHRKNQEQQAPGEATSMLDDGGAMGGPQAAAMEGTSLKGQAGAEAIGDDAQSWFENEPAPNQSLAEQGASGGPGAAPERPGDPASADGQPRAGAQGGPPETQGAQGGPPQAQGAQGGPGAAPAGPAGASAADPGSAAAAQSLSSPAPDAGASGGPGAAPQAAGAQPGAPGQSLREDESMKAPGDAAVSWLEREPGADGVPGMPGMPGMPGAMPGMPGAQPAAGAMGGAPGAPGAAPSDLPPSAKSVMDRGLAEGPGGQAVSQLTGEQMQAPGLGAQSMISGEQVVPGAAAQSMQGEQGGPGAAGTSQMGGDIETTGEAARSLLDGSEQAPGGGAQGGAPEGGASGGPGQSMLEDDEAGAPGADGGPDSGGASGGPGGSSDGADDDDDAFFQGEKGSGEDDVGENPLGSDDDDDAFFQGEKGSGDDDIGEGDAPEDDDDDAFFQGAKGSSDDDEDDLVDPDDDRPDFGGASDKESDELDEDPLSGLIDEDESKPDKKPKKKSKSVDPAYVTAGVLSAIVLLIGGLLFVARDQLSELWPGIEGVYEALNLDDDNAEGLRLSAPQPVRIMKGGVQTLVVTGFVTNLTDQIKTVPEIKLMLIDANNEVVQETSSPPSSPTIDPNSTAPYRIELQLPIESATSLQVDWN